MNLVKEYEPGTCSEIIGRDKEINVIRQFLLDFPKVRKKALLLYGPPGAGKTSMVRALANDMGYELLEVNASDKRNAENIRNIVGSASKQASLFSKKKIILIDEVEGIYGTVDRGGVPEILKIVKTTNYPIIMSANNAYDKKLATLRKSAGLVKVPRLKYWDVYNLVKRVCAKEKIPLSVAGMKKIASLNSGDARGALNDLSSVSNDDDLEGLYEREKEENIFEVLKMVFKARTLDTSLSSTDRLRGMDINTLILWVGENIINEYEDPEEVRKAYDAVSSADVFMGRIHKRNYWRFLYYARLMTTLGVSFSKKEMYRKFSRYETPIKINKLFRLKSKRVLQKNISQKIGKHTHCSMHKAGKYYVHHLRIWKDAEGLDLNEKELEYLTQ